MVIVFIVCIASSLSSSSSCVAIWLSVQSLWAELYSPSADLTIIMVRFALAVLAAVQIAYAQDLFIPARQLRGSANASIPESPELPIENEPEDEPVEPEETTDASIIEVMPEDTLPNMTSAAEAQVSAEVWGRKCTFKTGSTVFHAGRLTSVRAQLNYSLTQSSNYT